MSITVTSAVNRKSPLFEIITTVVRQACDLSLFRHVLKTAQSIVFFTGAGISEESGLPTFEGRGAVWRTHTATALANPRGFECCPSVLWEFYNFRRELALKAQPNAAHLAIADFEHKFGKERIITTITQNVDHLHARAGSMNLIELHGNLFLTRCLRCHRIVANYNRPICPAFESTGSVLYGSPDALIPVECLPRCCYCGGLLRPHIKMFGESGDADVLQRADAVIKSCELCVVVSTPTLVYPAYTYPPMVAERYGYVAEFNNVPPPKHRKYNFYFEGRCARTIPHALIW